MKKLFLFALSAMMICGCSDEKVSTFNGVNCYPSQEINFDFLGGEQSIDIYFDFNPFFEGEKFSWNLTGGESWCQPSSKGGEGYIGGDNQGRHATITFSVDKYIGTDPRNAIFTITCRNKQTNIYLIQTGQNTIHVEKAGTLGNVLSNMNEGEIIALTITGNLNDEDFITIRDLYNLEYLDISEIPLTTLPANGFSSMSIKKVILPKNLQVIPQSLFKNCKQLEEVTIPSGVTEIKGGYEDNKCFGAFYNCKALKSINVPAGIEVLESGTFAYCENLETVTFAKNSKLNTIADGGSYTDSSSWPYKNYYYGVFSCCTSLTAIDFPNGLKTIGVYAFANARLPKLVFPASVETIEYAAFRGCRGISSISFATGSALKTIKSSAFTRDYDDNLVFWSLKTVDMSACTQIESIGSMAFSENESLELFKIGTITPPTCESDAFSEIKSFSILKVPSESVAAYKQATGWKEFANISALD